MPLPTRNDNDSHSRLIYLLAAAVIAAGVFAYTSVGPASSTVAASRRTATAQMGVVQQTVSGSGTIEPGHELDLGFKTAGTVSGVYVSEGEHVTDGQLIAALDPKNAEVTLEQARATLQSAEATLVADEEATSATATATAAQADAASSAAAGSSAPSDATQPSGTGTGTGTGAGTGSGTGTGTGSGTRAGSGTRSGSATNGAEASTSPAAREASIASARAAVQSDRLAVEDDEEALQNTKLYAPESGTILSLSGEVGEAVSASGTTKAAAGEAGTSSGSGGSSSAASRGAGTSATGGASSDSSSASASSSSSAFAVVGQLSSMQMVVAVNQSEVGEIRTGQPATVTVEALDGAKLAASVTGVSALPVSGGSSGVVSYDVTFQLEQIEAGVKPGMSGTAEVVVKQAEGVNVPSSAVTGDTVTVLESGKEVRRAVVTGLVGNTSTLILSGLKAGEEVVLPEAAATTSSTGTSRFGSRAGGAGFGDGFGGAGLGGGGFPGAARAGG